MYKVKIYIDNSNEFIKTEMPVIPKKGDLISCYIDGDYDVLTVESIQFQFSKKDKYENVDINCIRD